MNDTRKKDKEKRKRSHHKSSKERKRDSSSSSSSDSDKWVEKPSQKDRDDWMSMTGMFKTYTKDEIKPKQEKEKKNIDSYNPSTSVRELNPYWKNGGSGLPETQESFRKSRQFIKPSDDDDYYRKPSGSKSKDDDKHSTSSGRHGDDDRKSKGYDKKEHYSSYSQRKSSNWKRESEADKRNKMDGSSSKQHNLEQHDRQRHKSRYDADDHDGYSQKTRYDSSDHDRQNQKSKNDPEADLNLIVKSQNFTKQSKPEEKKEVKYLSDEKMNKLAAKIVKAEIMGDAKLAEDLKAKLEAAREYRKQNPDAKEEDEDEGIMLMSTNSAGNSMPLIKPSHGDSKSKGGKRKAETHSSGERMKYFGNDDKYNLAQMFQQEKYGTNYDDEAQLAKITGKLKNPNDDLEDIFVDEISKNKHEAMDSEKEKQRAINQHKKLERSLEGCEYCVDSKNMLKHLIVSMGSKVYVALPARKSMVKGQCYISTLQHHTCVTSLDEDVWEEIMDYRKALTNFFNSQGQDVVFFEIATRLHKFPHMVINCVPLPRDVGDCAAIYFKKALLECEAEWSMNKKVVELKGKNIRRGVPKGLPYFWIDFAMDPGFAHVIEDQQLFPKTFGEEIIAGILDLNHNSWMKPYKEHVDQQRRKVVEFIKEWKPFDIASKIKS